MDAVSYSLASKQAQRIEKFIENPDSTSGIVTVPKTIASGETVTVPAGRVAVLPNLQIDGTLDIQGDVFIPSGATFGDLEMQLALKAPILSPALTGTPTAPTQTAGDNSTKLATTAYVDGKMVRGTAVNATGTAIDFTGIPNWVKRITVMFNGVSTSGGSNWLCQLGSTAVQTSGYVALSSGIDGGVSTSSYSNGFGVRSGASSNNIVGNLVILLCTEALYSCSFTLGTFNNSVSFIGAGSVTLSGTLDRLRITTVNGTDTFDAGQINIMYEG